jgi:hypothetical protein
MTVEVRGDSEIFAADGGWLAAPRPASPLEHPAATLPRHRG